MLKEIILLCRADHNKEKADKEKSKKRESEKDKTQRERVKKEIRDFVERMNGDGIEVWSYELPRTSPIDDMDTKEMDTKEIDIKELDIEDIEDKQDIEAIFRVQSDQLVVADSSEINRLQKMGLSGETLPFIGVGDGLGASCRYQAESLEGITSSYARMVYARFYHEPLVIAETEHLLIREMTMQDLDQLYEVYDTLTDCPFVEQLYEREEEEAFSADYIHNMYGFYGYGLWVLLSKEENRVIGRAGIENRELDGQQIQELGYLMGTPWQGKHLTLEACKAILTYAFDQLELEELFLCCEHNNKPSIALAQKLGFAPYADATDGLLVYRLRSE